MNNNFSLNNYQCAADNSKKVNITREQAIMLYLSNNLQIKNSI